MTYYNYFTSDALSREVHGRFTNELSDLILLLPSATQDWAVEKMQQWMDKITAASANHLSSGQRAHLSAELTIWYQHR